MFAHMRMRSAGFGRWKVASCRGRFAVPAVLLACSFLLQSCANPPVSPHAGRDAADPAAPAAVYRPATMPYVSRRPVEPKAWRDPNTADTPQNR
jgi:hypothetical protein